MPINTNKNNLKIFIDLLAFAFIMALLCYINLIIINPLIITTMNKLTSISRQMVCESQPLTKESKKHLNYIKQQYILMSLTLVAMFGMFLLIILF